MNIREAILSTADLVENNPAMWDFDVCEIPSCGTPGCALGWIGFYMGHRAGDSIQGVTDDIGLPNSSAFYRRVGEIANEIAPGETMWQYNAPLACRALRAYADKWHPKTERSGIPSSVRAIFENCAVAC